MLDKEYHTILTVQAINSFDTSDESELLMKKLLIPLLSLYTLTERKGSVFLL
jgi:hypothetical protein